MDHLLELETLARISCELSLAVCIKLFCDNGRVHWRDFVNDFLHWVPGVNAQPGSGLERQIAAAIPAPVIEPETIEERPLPVAA